MLLEEIRRSVLNNTELKDEDLTIRGLWAVDCLFKPNPDERTFNFKFIVAQTIGQGCAYSAVRNYDVKYLESLMGKNYRDIKIEDTALDIAILDSIYSTIQRKPDDTYEINGTSIEKTDYRTKIVIDETEKLIDRKNLKGKKPLVCNVGVVGNFVRMLIERNIDVVGTDFDKSITGRRMFDAADVYYGDRTLEFVKKSDVALITGMTLATNTMDDIIKVAKENNTKVIVFAETGSNLGCYMTQKGVDCVVGEPFPFYIFQGKNTINIFRKK